MRVFGFNDKGNGSYIDSISRTELTNVNGIFSRTEKGLAWKGDGSSTYIDIGNPIPAGSSFTIVTAIKVGYDAPANQTIIGNCSDGVTGSFVFQYTSANLIAVYIVDSGVGNQIATPVTTFTPGDYIFIIVKYDSATRKIAVAFNNSAYTTSAAMANDWVYPTAYYPRIGCNRSQATGNNEQYFNGSILDMVFYDEVITEQKRADHYEEFLQATPMLTEKYLKYGSWTKPTSLNEVGLVAAYNFIPSAGGVLVDISGNGNNGTINGAIQTLEGMSFDGVDDYVDCGTDSSLDLGTSDFTLTARIKSVTGGVYIIIGKLAATGSEGFHFEQDSFGKLDLFLNGSSHTSGKSIDDNQWHNVLAVRNGTNIILYCDGIKVYDDIGSDATITNVKSLVIGVDSRDLLGYEFKGEIADVKFYNYAFTAQQAAQYHNQFANRVVLADDLSYDPIGSDLPIGWSKSGGTFSIAEDGTGKYILCGSNGNIVYPGIDLSSNINNGFIKKLSGDLNSDEGKLISEATNISYANNKITVAMTTGQKFRDIYITKGYRLRAVTPNNISVPLEFHLDGQDSGSFALDGTSVDQWNDLSGNSRHVLNTNNNATRPTYDINTGRVTFIEANSTFLQSAGFGPLAQPNTIFIVYKITGALNLNRFVFDGSSGLQRNCFYYNGSQFRLRANTVLSNGATDANDNIHCAEFNGVNTNYWINGVLKISGDVGALPFDKITLGVAFTLSSNADVEIMEVFGVNSILPEAERVGLTLGLGEKWGIL